MEAVTLKNELQLIEKARVEIYIAEKALRNFILSPQFLVDYIKFEEVLCEFQDRIVTLVQMTTSPELRQLLKALGAQEQQQGVKPQPQGQQLTLPAFAESFTLEKAIVVLASIVGVSIGVEQRLLPPISILAVVAGGLALAFAPQLKGLVESLMKKEEPKKEEIKPENLEDWIVDSLSKIRLTYMSARFLMKIQTQTIESLPDQYKVLGLDEALINREKYFKETLPHEFLDRIGRIIVACDRSIWQRKEMVMDAMVRSTMGMEVTAG